jgi:hypothetical protein
MGHADHHGMTIAHKDADGSQVVANWRTLPNGHRQLDAFKVSRDPSTGVQTRLYTDGRKVTTGRDFVTRSAPGHLSLTTHANGLREASLPNGKPVYRESFTTIRGRDGRPERAVVRTVYARVEHGKAFALRSPVRQVYDVVRFHGTTIYAYRPWIAPVAFYDPFYAPFHHPVAVAAVCGDCFSSDVEFEGPPEVYSDPADMVADMQISDGFEDGMSYGADDVPPVDGPVDPGVPPTELGDGPPDPETAGLTAEVNQLQNQVDAAEKQNAELREQLDEQQRQNANLIKAKATAAPAPKPAKPAKARIVVPADVRTQMHKQVQQVIDNERSQTPLSLSDVIASAEAQNYIFQVSSMIDATDVTAGMECMLSTGDLARFDQIPGQNDAVAEMKIITSKGGSCAAGVTVTVSIGDLQDMLSAFSQRLEANMRKAHDRIAQAAQKSAKG